MKRANWMAATAALAVCAAAIGAAQQRAGGPRVENQAENAGAKPAVWWLGSDSKVETGRIELIADAARWEAVWKEHRGDRVEKNANGFETWPQVDFATQCVLAVFDGKGKNSNGFFPAGIEDLGSHVRLRYDEGAFQTASFNGPDSGIATTSYGFMVFPRPVKTLVLEENVQNLIGGPAEWKERKRVEPVAAGGGR